jgi:hypothetical protein
MHMYILLHRQIWSSVNNLGQSLNSSWTSSSAEVWHSRFITTHGAKSMKTTFLTLATTLTIASATTSYHLSTLPQPTESQKDLITLLNTICANGTIAIFGLLNDNNDRPNPPADATPPEPKNSLPPAHPNPPTTATLAQSPALSPSNPPSSIHPQPIENAPTTPASED